LSTLASFVAPNGSGPDCGLIMDASGNLYGTTSHGARGYGAVYEFTRASGRLTTLVSFDGTDGQDPHGALVMDASGNLYGTASGGGPAGFGTVFELAAGSGVITTLASFNGTNGQSPVGGLVMDSRGNLYGTTYQGGASGDGTVFELAHASGTITTLASFAGTDGQNPEAALILDSGGNLYGTTAGGGANGFGTVFQLAQGSGTITTLASFNGANGDGPLAALIMDGSGNLYGTTLDGGASALGTVFELAHARGTITTVASFDGANGARPVGALILDSSGNLYGTTEQGGGHSQGTVFELAHGGSTVSTLASFNGANGYYPAAAVVLDGSGNLYGTTAGGGPAEGGTVFELAHGSRTITTLALFGYTEGYAPSAGLIMDSSGNLYGTTGYGGTFGDGTIFELPRGGDEIIVLASFDGSDGKLTQASLTMDGSGNLYGTAPQGGAYNDGTVFELAKGSGTITTLASFNGTDGASPYAGVLIDGSGNLYGTTPRGGASKDGTVFELAQGSGAITTLASFNGTNGKYPHGGVVMDGSGNLYGTTTGGGASNHGTVFEVAAGSGTITTLASFDGGNGTHPNGTLTLDSSGNLYGTTSGRPFAAFGTVFELAKGSGAITTLAAFNGNNGAYPYAGVVMDASGNLYGTTAGGPTSPFSMAPSTVFEVERGSGTITALATIHGMIVGANRAGVVLDSSGNLYGTTVDGGAASVGSVFEVLGDGLTDLTDQWTGANSAVDTNWSDGANWSLGVPPSRGQTVLFTNDASVKSFTSTVDRRFSIGVLNIDSSWGGTITVNGRLTVAMKFTLASGSIGGSGVVTVRGTAEWTGGQILVGSGGYFTNAGALTADTTSGNLVISGSGTFANYGMMQEDGTNTLLLENGATLLNTFEFGRAAVFDITDGGSVSQSGGGTFTNDGTLEKSGTGGTSVIATTNFSNTGTVQVSSGTLDVAATVAQVSGNTLTGGTWTVSSGAAAGAKLDITSAGRLAILGGGASVTLSGLNTTFTNVVGLSTIEQGSGFSLLGGRSFTTRGPLRNKGVLILGPGSVLTVNGNFSQLSTGMLAIDMGGTNAAPTFGQLVSTTGTVALAGYLYVSSSVVPAVGSSFDILDNQGASAIDGTFKGLREGAKFKVYVSGRSKTFQITYAGTDADGNQNVIITRIA
jgi:uncharacterized repeat protein (TIGR03803 family)